MPTKIMRARDLRETYGIRRSSLYNWIATSGFPKPMKLGPRAVGWPVEEVERWLAERNPGRPSQAKLPTLH